jgi:YegS/Rv2252/BmrU family lipid kinase
MVLIANPASQNGHGKVAALEAADLLREALGEDHFELIFTERAHHAIEIIEKLSSSVDCVIALGGDGLINEAANGLMMRPENDRPTLAVIPVGSGNDYAETLKMAYNVPDAVKQVLAYNTSPADVGLANGRYYVETLSFGLDAAIALDTMTRRVKTGHTGTRLYLESAFDQIFHHLNEFRVRVKCTDPKTGDPLSIDTQAYLIAVQLGPTYGGHFRICPKASITDGLFDIAWVTPHLNPLHALAVLLRAKMGKHTGSPHMHFQMAEKVTLDFEKPLPAQIDGERIEGTHFEISCLRHAITVIKGF